MLDRIKEQQPYMHADRTSTHWMRSNQVRLDLSSVVYVLMSALRRLALAGTELAHSRSHPDLRGLSTRLDGRWAARSWAAWRLIQSSGVVPKAWESSQAVSGVEAFHCLQLDSRCEKVRTGGRVVRCVLLFAVT